MSHEAHDRAEAANEHTCHLTTQTTGPGTDKPHCIQCYLKARADEGFNPGDAAKTFEEEEQVAMIAFLDAGAHDGAGWYFWDKEYPDEGSCGAFVTREEAERIGRINGYARFVLSRWHQSEIE